MSNLLLAVAYINLIHFDEISTFLTLGYKVPVPVKKKLLMMPEKREYNSIEATGEETLKLHLNFTCTFTKLIPWEILRALWKI